MTNPITTIDSLGAHDASWHVSQYRDLIHATLQEAAKHAAHIQRDILTSITWPVAHSDPIQRFSSGRQAGIGECFFWERPADQHALVGIGVAATIETQGSAYLNDAASAWRTLLQDAVIAYAPGTEALYGSGAVFFGGFAFDPLHARTALWGSFPDGFLLLPRILFSQSIGRASLTVNVLLKGTDDIELVTRKLEDDVAKLAATCAHIPSTEEEPGAALDLIIQDIQAAREWMELVRSTAQHIREGKYEKVVLARSVHVSSATQEQFNIDTVLQRLRHSHPRAYTFAIQRGERFFAGATPERLVQAQDGQIYTMALAGSAPRGASEEEDQRFGAALLNSDKNNIEHTIVVDMLREALSHSCTNVEVAAKPQLLKLQNVQHLETPIAGTLQPGSCILDVLAELHPTPAVGGFPREVALTAIRNTEALDRGWYAGPVGWIGAGGHGEFAVALRSGLLDGNEASLFAGCGIVADSDPQSEYEESCLKLQVMLRGLGGENPE